MGNKSRRSPGQIREEIKEAKGERKMGMVTLTVGVIPVGIYIGDHVTAEFGEPIIPIWFLIVGLVLSLAGFIIYAHYDQKVKDLIRDLGEAEEGRKGEEGEE